MISLRLAAHAVTSQRLFYNQTYTLRLIADPC